MSLGLPKNASGDFKPFVKYDARAGRMFRRDREDGENTDVEITQGFAAVFDMPNIEVGWVKFAEGGAPDWAVVKIGQPLPARPSPDHRQGFKVDIKLAKSSGGDVREFGSSAGCVIGALDKLHDEFSAHPDSRAGKLPIVALEGTVVVKSGQGAKTSTNYAPNFVIKSWVARPAEMPTMGGENSRADVVMARVTPAQQTAPNLATEF